MLDCPDESSCPENVKVGILVKKKKKALGRMTYISDSLSSLSLSFLSHSIFPEK